MINVWIFLSILVLFLGLNSEQVFADSLTEAYVDVSNNAKSSYSNALQLLESAIQTSENSLTGIVFENSEAKEKINSAWETKKNSQQAFDITKKIWYEGDWYLQNYRYKESYDNMKRIDSQIDIIHSQLQKISQDMNTGKKLEDDYQYNNRFCFLFWCSSAKNYDWVDFRIKDLDLKIAELEKKQQSLNSEDQKLDLRINQLYIKDQQTELARKQAKIDRQEEIKRQQQIELEQKQRQVEEQERMREQEQQTYEKQLKEEKKTQLEILAATNPLLKQIMTGRVTFWVEPIPNYAAPGISDSVDDMLKIFESWNGVSRVYNEGEADIKITWIRDFNPNIGGQYWQSYIQVGLGSTGCYGKWQPFVSHTVRQILWHELGHAMGYDHSTDPNNIMRPAGPHYYYKEYEDDVFLENGHLSWISFCNTGQYTFSLSGNSKSDGFEFYVITPETDPKTFLNGEGGRHYPNCTKDGIWISYTLTCDVVEGSKLLIYNPPELGGSAINVDVVTQYTGNMQAYDMIWDPSTLRESAQYYQYLSSLQ